MRTDIPLADQIVQVGHACLLAGTRFVPDAGCHLVVLGVPGEARLLAAVAEAEMAGIRCVVFFEPDDDLGDTAACTAPVDVDARPLFRRYALWRARSAAPRERAPPGHAPARWKS